MAHGSARPQSLLRTQQPGFPGRLAPLRAAMWALASATPFAGCSQFLGVGSEGGEQRPQDKGPVLLRGGPVGDTSLLLCVAFCCGHTNVSGRQRTCAGCALMLAKRLSCDVSSPVLVGRQSSEMNRSVSSCLNRNESVLTVRATDPEVATRRWADDP